MSALDLRLVVAAVFLRNAVLGWRENLLLLISLKETPELASTPV